MPVKNRRFSGGYRFSRFEGEPGGEIIEIGIPEKVIIPLKQGFGKEVKPVVNSGDRVEAGQIIGRNDDSISTPVHSSVNGIVEEIVKIDYFGIETESVVIKSDSTAGWKTLKDHTSEWEKLSAEKIEQLLYLSGASSLDSAGIPTRFRSSLISPEEVEHVIIQGTGSDVYNVSLNTLIGGEKLNHFLEGLRILKTIMPAAVIHIALNKHQKKLVYDIDSLTASHDWVKIYTLEPKYPQEYDGVLIPTILKRSYPYGFLPVNIGIVVLGVQTILHVYDAVVPGKPLIERIIPICGPGFTENLHLKVRVGTSFKDITIGKVKLGENFRFITDSPLSGKTIPDLDLPIDRTCSKIITLHEKKTGEMMAFAKPGFIKDSYSRTFVSSFLNFKKMADTNIHGEERACIFCGFCEQVCPAGIIPHLLFRYTERDMVDEILVKYRIFKCIDCNLCTYVCPSKIQIGRYIKEGKKKLTEMGIDYSEPVLRNFELKGLEEYKGLGE
jgi:Na(+)-translocating NADH:ubiquinone oxidoreductase A subunit